MAYKVFANGNPLLASELNDNLMQQVIAVFTSSSSRDATLTSPVEGQFVYLSDTGVLTYYDGSAWTNYGEEPPAVSEQTGSTYTITASDSQTTVFVNNASGTTVTIDDEIEVGARIDFIQKGAGAITFAAGSGVTLNSKESFLTTTGQYAAATVIKEATNVYYLIGSLEA